MVIMVFVVKNTTKWRLIDLVAPHSCRGCGRIGAVLCECCKIYNKEQQKAICPLCRMVVAENYEDGGKLVRCPNCETEMLGLFVVGWRKGALRKLVSEFKYESVRAAGEVLVEMLDEVVPDFAKILPEGAEVVVVPLPTIGRHVRQRGLDHTLVLARKLAKRRGWRCEKVLTRAADTVQVGAKAKERREQAERAYEVVRPVDTEKYYLLLDDVWTTGASMKAAERVMREAGAEKIMGAVIEVGEAKPCIDNVDRS